MDYIIVILAFISALLGTIGALLPALPGPPLSYISFLILLLCKNNNVDITEIIVTSFITIIIIIADYVAPIWFTKKRGGSKYGVWGAGIGMFFGLFFGLWGVIFAPFIGAFIGELMARKTTSKALSTAFMSFIAFMFTTGIKFIYSISMLVIIVIKSCKILW